MEFDPLPQQSLAIEAPLGPVLVVAGPGAGKTFCLIARINHLVTTVGIAPERICAVTFTNRAAEEIAVRLKHTLRDRAAAVTRGATGGIPARLPVAPGGGCGAPPRSRNGSFFNSSLKNFSLGNSGWRPPGIAPSAVVAIAG